MKLLRVSSLSDGTRFKIPSLEASMRHMKVIRVSDCSTLVRGQQKNNIEDSWTGFEHAISNNTNVVIDNDMIPEEILEIVKEQTNTNEIVSEDSTPKNTGKKGKPRMEVTLSIPDDRFTMKEIAAMNQMYSQPLIYLRIMEMLKTGTVKLVDKIQSGRGKPSSVYQKI